MGNGHTKEEIKAWTFLTDIDSPSLFATVDYALKGGKHIQRWKEQENLFRFIERNEESLRIYYSDYFGVYLEHGGESIDKYYYLDFMAESRGGIPPDNRHFMLNEHIIIGFLLYKIIFIDQFVELNSLATFQKMIRHDYEDIKPGLYRALARAKRERTTEMNDGKVDDIIANALKSFAKIGWIELDGQTFDPLPSFQRLPKLYGDYINTIDDLLKKRPPTNEGISENT